MIDMEMARAVFVGVLAVEVLKVMVGGILHRVVISRIGQISEELKEMDQDGN